MKPLGLIGRRHMWKSEGGFCKCTRTREKAYARKEIEDPSEYTSRVCGGWLVPICDHCLQTSNFAGDP